MTSHPSVLTSDRTAVVARRWSAAAATLGLAVLVLAAWAAYVTARDDSDADLAGVGYLLALALAVPGGVSLVLAAAACGLSSRRPEPALTCAVAGALVSGGTLGMVLATVVSG